MRITLLFTCLLLFSCGSERKAMKDFRYGKYEKVIDHYKSVINKKSNNDNGKANYYIAESYRLSNRIREAEPYYEKAKSFKQKRNISNFYYALALKANGKYAEALKELHTMQSYLSDDKLKEEVARELSTIDYLKKLDQKKNYYEVKNMTSLNTPMSEYAPVYFKDLIYFTASREGSKIYTATNTPFTKLYQVTARGAEINIKSLKPLSQKINSEVANEGCVAFSPNGKIMVFAKGNTGKRKGSPDVDLYMSRLRKGKWTEGQRIIGNLPNAWESTPAFSSNGRYLYFSSNRKGGYGGLDLYIAKVSSRGRLSQIRNLGSSINTSENELFPFVSKEGKLFFASDGHPGYGMLDLFEVVRKKGKKKVENMGKPINSSGDDFGIFLYKPDRGFFTSNRAGGKGNDDIYTFVNRDPNLRIVNYYLRGTTMGAQEDDLPPVILSNARVKLLDAEKTIVQEYTTGRDGKFFFQLHENEDYTLIGSAKGYLVKRQFYTTKGKSVRKDTLKVLETKVTFDTVLVLDPLKKDKVFVLKNIYFDFDKYNIRRDATRELDKLVNLLRDNPEIKIEMGSHTDSIASHQYNITLSQQRAESTVSYLITKGISPDRLTAKGYGEEKPIAPNTYPDGSDNPIGRQKNRRTEFKIVEIGPSKEKNPDKFEEDKYFDD